MSSLLSIAAELAAPPSSPTTFRDVTLISSIRGYETVALVEEGTAAARDAYNRWFRTYGLWDYVEDLLLPDELDPNEVAIVILGGGRLTLVNLHEVLRYIRPL